MGLHCSCSKIESRPAALVTQMLTTISIWKGALIPKLMRRTSWFHLNLSSSTLTRIIDCVLFVWIRRFAGSIRDKDIFRPWWRECTCGRWHHRNKSSKHLDPFRAIFSFKSETHTMGTSQNINMHLSSFRGNIPRIHHACSCIMDPPWEVEKSNEVCDFREFYRCIQREFSALWMGISRIFAATTRDCFNLPHLLCLWRRG